MRQYNFVQKQLINAQIRIITIKNEFLAKINKQKQKIAKLRQFKNEHKRKKNDYVEKIRIFRVDKTTLKKKIQNLKIKQSDYFIVSYRYFIVFQNSNFEENFLYRNNRRQNFYNA